MRDEESLFFRRRSKRAYLDRDVPQDVLDRVIEKVRWSPSCFNNQPWRFIFVRDAERKNRFVGALPEANRWAAAAPVLIALCAKAEDDYRRKDNAVSYHQIDGGIALMALLLAAADEGLMGHAMAGYDASGVQKALDVPEEYDVLCVVALGYEGSPDQLDETTRKKDAAPNRRKAREEIVAFDRFDFD